MTAVTKLNQACELMTWKSMEEAREALHGAVAQFGEDMRAFCKVLASAFEQYPTLREEFGEQFPHLRNRLKYLEEIGRGELPHEFALVDSRKLSRLRQLSTAQQRQLTNGQPLPVVDPAGEVRMMTIDEMDDTTFRLAIGEKGIRTPAEQRSELQRLANMAAATEARPQDVPFHLDGKYFVADKPFRMHREQMLKLLLG